MAKARRNREDNGTTTVATTDEQRDGATQQERIAARAYELYLARGGTDGQDWDDWLAAERELANDQPGRNRTE